MDLSTFITLVKGRLLRNTDTSLDTIIVAEAELVRQRYESEQELPYWLKADLSPTDFVTEEGLEDTDLPSTFLRFLDDTKYVLWYQTADDEPWVHIERMQLNEMIEKWDFAGVPRGFYLLNRTLYMRPIPDDVYQLRVLCYKTAGAITAATTTNLWLTNAADIMLSETVYTMATKYIFMPEVAQVAQQDILVARKRLFTEGVVDEEMGRMRDMGED